MWMWDAISCGVGVLQLRLQRAREPHDLGRCLHLRMGSLRENSIGDEGAGYLGAALQVNTTLTELM
jgi:hypothetical protein